MRRLTLLLVLVVSSLRIFAMNYEDARNYAWYLTDKMAYELNLTPDQYDMVYEINMEYFLSVNRRRDISGDYWYYRNLDFQNVLYDWQYSLYRTFEFFYRPLTWRSSRFVFCPYSHYHRSYYYFECPRIYHSYIGGCWTNRRRHTPSPYHGMFFTPGGGMRDRWNNLPHHSGHNNYHPAPQPNRNHNYGNNRPGYRQDNDHNRPGNGSGNHNGPGNHNGNNHGINGGHGNHNGTNNGVNGGHGTNNGNFGGGHNNSQSVNLQPTGGRGGNTANRNQTTGNRVSNSTTRTAQPTAPTTTTVTRQPSQRTNQVSGFSGQRQSSSIAPSRVTTSTPTRTQTPTRSATTSSRSFGTGSATTGSRSVGSTNRSTASPSRNSGSSNRSGRSFGR